MTATEKLHTAHMLCLSRDPGTTALRVGWCVDVHCTNVSLSSQLHCTLLNTWHHCTTVSLSPQLYCTPPNTWLLLPTLLCSHYTDSALNITFHLHLGLPTELFPSGLRLKWSPSFQTPVISYLFSLYFHISCEWQSTVQSLTDRNVHQLRTSSWQKCFV